MALESEIEATIKWVKEERSGTTEDSSEIVVEAEKNLLKLKREYNQLIRNYNKKCQKQGGRFKMKYLERIKFGDEFRRDWGILDQDMEEWVASIFFGLYFED